MDRIVLISRRFWPLVGGAERNTANLAAALADRGAEVTVLSACWQPGWPAEIAHGDVRLVRLAPPPAGGWKTMRYARAMARWLRAQAAKIDVVYVSHLQHEACAALRAVGGRVPVVLRAESAGPSGDCQWQLHSSCGRHVRRRCQLADALIAPTPTILQELIAAGYPRSRMIGLTTGVPIPPARSPQRRTAAREALASANPSLRLSGDVPLAVYVGRLERTRGLIELLAAWQAVLVQRPDARLWLIGEGPHPFVGALREQIEHRRLSGRVVLGGTFDHAEEVLAAADLFVLPVCGGGAPLAMLEAMAAGLPIITVDVAEHRELLTGDREALLIVAPTAERLAAATLRLLDDGPWAAELGAAARARAIRRYSLERMGNEHLQFFRRLLG